MVMNAKNDRIEVKPIRVVFLALILSILNIPDLIPEVEF